MALPFHVEIFLLFSNMIFSAFVGGNSSSTTSITVINDCSFTVWPAISSTPVLNITGFELKKGTQRKLQVTPNWSGSIWGRTGCSFNGTARGSCATGDCNTGEIECYGKNYTRPVTIAEINIKTDDEFYDVSILNGYNLPMTIEPSGGWYTCEKTGCVGDLNKLCPVNLRLKGGGGCNSPCHALPSPESCCRSTSGHYATCTRTSYGHLFYTACPKSVTYGYDDFENIYSCRGAEYIVRFCPPADTFSTIKLGGQLNSTEQLVSMNGDFRLMFFGTDNKFLGVWYYVKYRNVWMASPNSSFISSPISDSEHSLSIDPISGNLIITSKGVTVTRITDVQAGPNPNVTAKLQDDGNFQLINEADHKVLWQSFDHPTEVLLPGMKLGFDKTTRMNWTLTSWKNNEYPDSGDFTLTLESQRLVIRKHDQPYWTSGNVKEAAFQSMFGFYGYKFTYEFNDKQHYIYYEKDAEVENLDVNDLLPTWELTRKGQLEKIQDSLDLLTPELCYGFSSDTGCIEKSGLPECRIESDNFSNRNGEFASNVTKFVTDRNSSLSISDCFDICWKNCSCLGFNNSNRNESGCVFWSGINIFLANPHLNSSFIYVINARTPTSSRAANKTKDDRKWIWILIGTAVSLIFLGFGLLWCRKKRNQRREEEKRKKRDEYFLELTASESFKDVHELESDGGNGNDLLVFSFALIMAATDDFSFQNKLGQGGFGPVYKGKLSDGREIAIKRLSKTSGQGLVEFKNELLLIARLQHTNLVRILGCCIHGDEKMLIYEYMPNKSLDFFIFDENKRAELDWPKRFNIIEGIAQGLLYLHKYSRMRVIHRDLKAGNILLDENMNPKISDFGMARIFKQDDIVARTNRVVGTYGYMSPEYAMEGAFSVKSDIYSFGVLILEIVTGRKNSSFAHLDDSFSLIGYAWELWQQKDALELKDPTLGSTCNEQQFLRTVHVALLCVQDSATDRPTTSDMISMLLNDTVVLPPPNKPPFVTRRVDSLSTSVERKPKDFSINDMTVTLLDAR